MNTRRGTICLWLCLMCAGVECWPKVRLSSREEKDKEPPTLTILYLIDTTVNATEENVKTFIGFVNKQAEQYLQSFFDLKIHLNNRTKYVDKDPTLKTLMEQNNNNGFVYTDGTIQSLASYYEKLGTRPDIIGLVTGRQISDGADVYKGYGYFKEKTLCESPVTMLLAYSLEHHNDISNMLAQMIRDSVNPTKVPYVHQKFSNLTDSMSKYLSECKGSFGPEEPPEGPAQPSTQKLEVPETTPPSGPPPPPGPPVPPETPVESSSTEGPTSTTTLTPVYC